MPAYKESERERRKEIGSRVYMDSLNRFGNRFSLNRFRNQPLDVVLFLNQFRLFIYTRMCPPRFQNRFKVSV